MQSRHAASQKHSYIAARDVKSLSNFPSEEYQGLSRIGIHLTDKVINKMIVGAMDNLQPLITTPSIPTPIQFLQNWLPGFVHVITAARKIDQLVGISVIGAWEDEEIVQGIMELTGTSVPYGDYTNTPLSSWNTNWERRTVVRFEEGMFTGNLDAARAARIQVNASSMNRESAALALEIQRNAIGFYGFNNGANRTYGFLNDPGLPAYVTVAAGASTSTLWSRKTFLEINADIRTMAAGIQTNSQDQINAEDTNMTLVVATAVYQYLTVTSDFGISVKDWIKQAYPRMRIVSAPELNGANSNANVAYMYADSINDDSTDDGRAFIQVVPAKFMVEGVQPLVKGTLEGYTNATAGVMCKRPWMIYRASGM
jgi:major capsid protein